MSMENANQLVGNKKGEFSMSSPQTIFVSQETPMTGALQSVQPAEDQPDMFDSRGQEGLP